MHPITIEDHANKDVLQGSWPSFFLFSVLKFSLIEVIYFHTNSNLARGFQIKSHNLSSLSSKPMISDYIMENTSTLVFHIISKSTNIQNYLKSFPNTVFALIFIPFVCKMTHCPYECLSQKPPCLFSPPHLLYLIGP